VRRARRRPEPPPPPRPARSSPPRLRRPPRGAPRAPPGRRRPAGAQCGDQRLGQRPGQLRVGGRAHRGRHPRGVPAQHRQRLGQPGHRRPDGRQQLGERGPLGVPGARAAFVLLLHGGQERGDQPRGAAGAGPRGDRGHRIGLVRHRRRATPPRRHLGDLGHLALGEQHHVKGDRGDHPGGGAQQPGQVGDRQPDGEPRDIGGRQPQLRGELAAQVDPGSATGGQRPHRPAVLDRQRRGHGRQPGPDAVQAGQPGGDLEPDGERQRLLHERPAHQHVVPVVGGERGTGRGRGGQVGVQQRQRAPGQQHRRGVDDVLAGGAHVHRPGGVRADRVLQGTHQRRDRVAGVRRLPVHGQQVQPRRVGAGLGHLGRRGLGDQPGARRGPGERGLGVQQGVQPGVAADRGGHRPAREGAVQEARHAPVPRAGPVRLLTARRRRSRPRPAGGGRGRTRRRWAARSGSAATRRPAGSRGRRPRRWRRPRLRSRSG